VNFPTSGISLSMTNFGIQSTSLLAAFRRRVPEFYAPIRTRTSQKVDLRIPLVLATNHYPLSTAFRSILNLVRVAS
jgi:hypothetical protein